jgi:hypothetical protein
MNKYLTQSEKLLGEEVLGVTPYKPFSVLIVTNKRVIGKRLLRVGPKRFEGEILLTNITNIEFNQALLFFTTPSIVLECRQLDGRIEKSTIRFPGSAAKLAGFDPEEIYRLIVKGMNNPDIP